MVILEKSMFFHTLNTEKHQRENDFELFSDASPIFCACWHSHFAETTKRDHSETHLPQARSIFFMQKVRSSVKMPLANSFSHLYSKSAFLLSAGEIRIIFSPKCVSNRFPARDLGQPTGRARPTKWVHGLGVRTWLHARVMRTVVKKLPQTKLYLNYTIDI